MDLFTLLEEVRMIARNGLNYTKDIFTRKASAVNGPFTTLSVVYLCDVLGGELRLSHEGRALRCWKIDEVPDWHATHEQHARASYKEWQKLLTCSLHPYLLT